MRLRGVLPPGALSRRRRTRRGGGVSTPRAQGNTARHDMGSSKRADISKGRIGRPPPKAAWEKKEDGPSFDSRGGLAPKGKVSNACCMLVLHAGKRSLVTTQAAGPSHARDGPPSSESPWIRVMPCASIRVGPLPRSSDPHPSHRGGSESWGKQADPRPPFLRRLAGPSSESPWIASSSESAMIRLMRVNKPIRAGCGRTLIRVTVDQIPCAPSPSGSARGPPARRGEREGGQEEVTRAERREVRRLARSCREPRAEGGETWTLLPGRGPSARAGGPAWGRCESAGRESDSERLGLGCG